MLFNGQVLNDIHNTQTTRGSNEIISFSVGRVIFVAYFCFLLFLKFIEETLTAHIIIRSTTLHLSKWLLKDLKSNNSIYNFS